MRRVSLWILILLLCCVNASAEELLTIEQTEAYETYLARYAHLPVPEGVYEIAAIDYVSYEGTEPQRLMDFKGVAGESLLLNDDSSVSWRVSLQEEGLYIIELHDYLPASRGRDATRTLLIDGKVPCDAASGVKLRRTYVNALDDIRQDTYGNDMRPQQMERPLWRREALEDSRGYAAEPLQIYLPAGEHLLTLEAQSEPIVLHDLTLRGYHQAPPYEQVAAAYAQEDLQPGCEEIRIEAERATAKSSPMLYARNDRSSVSLSPSDPVLVRINTIGGNSWNQAGQWIEWIIDVPQDGLYTLTLHARQDFVRGLPVLRKLTIDGQPPFREAEQIAFYHHSGWQWITLGDTSGEPYQFFLTAGTHTLRLTNVLGWLTPYIQQVETALNNLNGIYRQVVMITGAAPDTYRDYQLSAKLPELGNWLVTERERLQEVLTAFEEASGRLGEREAPLKTMVNELDKLTADTERMIPSLNDFRTSISSIGTWLTQAVENPLQLDELVFTPSGDRPRMRSANFLEEMWYEARSLLASYWIDYNAMGSLNEKAETTITVWVATGRDQANIIKTLSDELFTPESGINVELALVDVNSLLPAILAGQGPDVAMLIGGNLPMNYAMRGAVTDLTQFADFEEVATRFHPEAMVPFQFRDSCYALPETLSFPMLFYRKDILLELDLDVPRTWDEVKAAISVLSKNSMYFGMSSLSASGSAVMNIQTPYSILLFQAGGAYYTEDGRASALASPMGIEAFKELTKLYSDYTLESDYDFINLFRTGLMPLGIADLGTFNTLQVFAPELDGLWGFTRIPGTVRENGRTDYTAPCGGMAIVIMENSDDKDAAWEYLKWWTSADTQVRYSRELETLMGAAARYATANLEAFSLLPWDRREMDNIMVQYNAIKGVPEVPGGYYTVRCVANAFYDVVVEKSIGAREALMDQVAVINAEIAYKREEFGIEEVSEP